MRQQSNPLPKIETKPTFAAQISKWFGRLRLSASRVWGLFCSYFAETLSDCKEFWAMLLGKDAPLQDPTSKSGKEAVRPAPNVPSASVTAPSAGGREQIAERTTAHWWDEAKPYVEVAGVALLAIYTGYTIGLVRLAREQVRIAQNTYNSQQRPYVGGAGIRVSHRWYDPVTKESRIPTETRKATAMHFEAGVQNYGPVPGRRFVFTWRVLVDGIEQKGEPKVPDSPSTIYPNQVVSLGGGAAGQEYQALVNGLSTMIIELRMEYDGPAEHYSECERYQFSPTNGAFFNLGECDLK